MSLNLRHARGAAAPLAIGVLATLLVGIVHPKADEFALLFDPNPMLPIAPPMVQLASLTPFEKPPEIQSNASQEPFGTETTALVKGGVQDKWRAVKRKLPREHKVLMHCRAHAANCPPAAQRFLAVLDKAQAREGWARIAEINRAINLDIRPVDDMTQYGVPDLWATPLMAFKSNAGDCEDYAIAKYVALQEIGVASDDLRLVIVHDRAANQDHAVTAVRYDGRWRILDNRTLAIRHDLDIAELDPLFVIDNEGVKRTAPLAAKPTSPFDTTSPAAMNPEFRPADQALPCSCDGASLSAPGWTSLPRDIP